MRKVHSLSVSEAGTTASTTAENAAAHLPSPVVRLDHDRTARPIEADGDVGTQRLAQGHHGAKVLQVERDVRRLRAMVLVVHEGLGSIHLNLRAQAALLACTESILLTAGMQRVLAAGLHHEAYLWQGR